METKHTKGEWVKNMRHTKKGASIITINIPNQPIIDFYQLNSDDCSSPICCATEQHANAKLIAAAPELLEALMKAKELIKRDGYGEDHLVVHKINNAIKKATEL